MYKWSRRVKKGEPYFECSSKGDKRFSAFYAYIDGKSIEEIYQLDIKGYRGKYKNILQAKGKPCLNKTKEECYKEYKALWRRYLEENDYIDFLLNECKDKTITDMFANSEINQARAICDILNEEIKYELDNKIIT